MGFGVFLMRPWMIVLSSAVAAIVVAGAVVEPQWSAAPRSDFASILLAHLAMIGVAALAVYALCAIVLATGTLIGNGLSVRHRLGRLSRYPTPTQRDWTTAFGSTELYRLVPSPVVEPARRAGANKTILMLVGLILLAILGRIAVDVSTEPLIEIVSQLAAEHVEIGLLRRLVEVLEVACSASAVNSGSPASTLQLPERLEVMIEEGQRGLVDAARHLSVATNTLGATIGSSVDALKTAVSTLAALPPTADRANEARLQSAVEALTAALERLTTMPEVIEEPLTGVDQAAPRMTREPHLARELRQLLQEIGNPG